MIVVAGNEGRLEHHRPKQSSPGADSAHGTHRSAVVQKRCKAPQSREPIRPPQRRPKGPDPQRQMSNGLPDPKVHPREASLECPCESCPKQTPTAGKPGYAEGSV